MALIACLAVAQSAYALQSADTDQDGLLDKWETHGFGPLDPSVHPCKPGRADLIVVFRLRSMMTRELIQPTLDRIAKFYSEVPITNPDGSKGINFIAIVPPPMPADTDTKGYIELYEAAMPREWRGLAHGVMLDNSPGGGGQANRPDWCGTGFNWHTIVHEVGHQLGLPHDPLGAQTGSPFHRSLMNYDYSYQLGGIGENVIYSDGKFESLKMKETDLNETVKFKLPDLEFLGKHPYYFKLTKVSETESAVDWNRNGVPGEKHVRADINDGYSVAIRDSTRGDRAAGAPSLAAVGKSLIGVYPTLDEKTLMPLDIASLAATQPGMLKAQIKLAGKLSAPQTLVDSGVTGDPDIIEHKGHLLVAYPTLAGVTVRTYRLKNGLLVQSAESTQALPGMKPTLVSTPLGAQAILWNPADRSCAIQSLPSGKLQPLADLKSKYAPGAAWNSKKKVLAMTTVEEDGSIKITEANYQKGEWQKGEVKQVGNAKTSARALILHDPSKDRGPLGAYNVYCKGLYPTPNQPGVNFCCRQIAEGDGWRIKMMGNEWALSRSVCAATWYKGDIAYAYRWVGGEQDHAVLYTERASGVEDQFVTDFNEVKFIQEHGLRDSLRAVQREQWVKRR